MAQSGMAWGHEIDVGQSFCESLADEGGDFTHKVSDFLPLGWLQVLLQLRMDRPLRVNPSSRSAHENAEEFHIPRHVRGVVTGRGRTRLFGRRNGSCHR